MSEIPGHTIYIMIMNNVFKIVSYLTFFGCKFLAESGNLKMIPEPLQYSQDFICDTSNSYIQLQPNNGVMSFHLAHIFRKNVSSVYMSVSGNSGTRKSSILIWFSIINHPFWGYPYLWKYPYRVWYRNVHRLFHVGWMYTTMLCTGVLACKLLRLWPASSPS